MSPEKEVLWINSFGQEWNIFILTFLDTLGYTLFKKYDVWLGQFFSCFGRFGEPCLRLWWLSFSKNRYGGNEFAFPPCTYVCLFWLNLYSKSSNCEIRQLGDLQICTLRDSLITSFPKSAVWWLRCSRSKCESSKKQDLNS